MPTSQATRDRILAETIRALDEGGDRNVRVARVAQAAGVTQGMVTYHFDTRDRLLAEAHARRIAKSINDDVGEALAAVIAAISTEEFVAGVRRLTSAVLSPDRRVDRERRLNALSYSLSDDELHAAMRSEYTETVDRFEGVFDTGKSRGFIRSDLDSRAIATMVMSYSFGLVISDFDEHAPSNAALTSVIMAFVEGLLAQSTD
ncbi:MAG: TetR/AcrR family transcriptional regulator [Actinobacteria bacterium]|nr:TetR/AcrR family transcriptional regulator [Actinomycetota bacterium]